jgi:hypothetical protein
MRTTAKSSKVRWGRPKKPAPLEFGEPQIGASFFKLKRKFGKRGRYKEPFSQAGSSIPRSKTLHFLV